MQFLNAFGSSALADLPVVCSSLPPMYDTLFMFLHSMMGTWTIPQSLAINDGVATICRLIVLHDFLPLVLLQGNFLVKLLLL